MLGSGPNGTGTLTFSVYRGLAFILLATKDLKEHKSRSYKVVGGPDEAMMAFSRIPWGKIQ